MAAAGSVYPPLAERPVKNTICLFDVDGTLGPARRVCPSRQNPPKQPELPTCTELTLPQSDRLPRHAPAPLCPAAQMRHRLRQRLRPRETARADRHLRNQRDLFIRLLLCGERTHGDSNGRETGEYQLRGLVGGGEVQGAGELLFEVYE